MRNFVFVLVLVGLLTAVGASAQQAATATDATTTVATPIAVTAAAAVTAVSPDDPGAIVTAAAEAGATGHWAVLVGFGLMLLVWGVKKVIPAFPAIAVPWLATALSFVGYLSHSLSQGGDWHQALVNGFLSGASAIGLWELVGKHLLAAKPAE